MRISGRALKAVISYPATWGAIALVALFEWGFSTWFEPGFLMAVSAVLAGLVAVVLWVVLLIRSGQFQTRLHERAIATIKLGTSGVGPDELMSELVQIGSSQGIAQLKMLTQKRDALTQVLRRRLNAGELAYSRYLGTAEQVYLSTLDNLHDVAVSLTGASGMDREYIEQRLAAIAQGDEPGESVNLSARKEKDTLEQRRSLLNQQLERVASLFAQNEAAMTALDNTTAALAQTRMEAGQATMSAEDAMSALEELAARTGRYAAGN